MQGREERRKEGKGEDLMTQETQKKGNDCKIGSGAPNLPWGSSDKPMFLPLGLAMESGGGPPGKIGGSALHTCPEPTPQKTTWLLLASPYLSVGGHDLGLILLGHHCQSASSSQAEPYLL